ncbi:MAG: hypothetical protein LBS09_04185 [Bacteroidales bacterium]|jgi:hypothetical protein|nr:hypothetical protein [Bacteroidales bacterium]
MKTNKFLSIVAAAIFAAFTACDKEKKDDTPVSEVLFENGTQIGNGEQEFEITSDFRLEKGKYVLKGWVYVCNGATLTIEKGTVIKGDKDTKAALVVEPGGKVIAEGTQDEPIVFTSAQTKGSRKPGDWGGLIICGRATNNGGAKIIEGGPRTTYGGSSNTDNSGVYRYIRVEFAGYPFKTDQEINGITLGSVGSGTTFDHVQVSYSNDDSFEWFGGAVNAKYLIAYKGWDDDFDTDNGFSGKIQYALAIRDPRIADTSRSNGFESDNDADGSIKTPFTSCTFSNVTMVGPRVQDGFNNSATYINGGDMNPDNGSKLGVFQAAMHLRRNTKLNYFNSVTVGFPVGLIVENDKGSTTQKWATDGELKIQNVYFGGMDKLGVDANGGTTGEFSASYFSREGGNNRSFTDIADLKLNAGKRYAPQTGSPLLSGASFTDDKVSSGFDKVTYAGAFASDADSDDWTAGWANFDPQNTDY